ncbi:MAG TPA: prephenate dehydrogenase [Propionicimonas sp.]|nr:prephenate dehydrogenase [Propionicimonas sp.]HQA77042.1 prephenate dehydrogenase [Propionicimonas sp.]HQD96172.1 prephenate dehydrogenase [Propionicimonas sp.]
MNAPVLSPALVIGTGLVGASVAHALTRAGVTVHLSDAVTSHARVAASRGAGTTTPPVAADVQLVVVAVPPHALAKVIAKSLRTFPNATVTDVGSVKGTVLAALRATDADLSRYVGSHPMAGSQRVGPLTANADLFIDRTWVVTPHDTSAAHAVLAVQELATLCGARRVTMGAAHHDEAVAQVSHLPHLMSVLVAGTLTRLPAEHLRLAGQGVRDVTRIAGSDPKLWQQIIGANSAAIRRELVEIQAELADMLAALDAGDLAEVLERGLAGTKALPGKHGLSPTNYAQVVVEIPDAPGALARLFRDIELAGVNVEDVSIDHDLEREVGYLSVDVAPDRAPGLAEAMTAAGWTVRDREPQP